MGLPSIVSREEGAEKDDDEHDLCVDPSKVERHDEETRLRHHHDGELHARPYFFEPVLGPFGRNVEFDLTAGDTSCDVILVAVVHFCDGASIRRTSGLGRKDVQHQCGRQDHDGDIEAPVRCERLDDAGANLEAHCKRSDRAPRPDTQPYAHTSTMPSHIAHDGKLLVRMSALQGSSEQIEEYRDEIYIGEAKDKTGKSTGSEEAGSVARIFRRSLCADGKRLGELKGHGEREGGEYVGFSSMQERERPEQEG